MVKGRLLVEVGRSQFQNVQRDFEVVVLRFSADNGSEVAAGGRSTERCDRFGSPPTIGART